MWSRSDLAWMAGLYEGEGTTYYNSKQLKLKFTMTDEDVLQTFRRVAGVGFCTGPYKATGLGKKPRYLFQCSGPMAYILLVAMWPWLHERRKAQARTAILGWIAHGRPDRKLTYTQIREIKQRRNTALNQHGKPTLKELAREYDVSPSLISHICTGKRYRGK